MSYGTHELLTSVRLTTVDGLSKIDGQRPDVDVS
jgi:hypothetical protein